jgi:FKBP-type peptidyl-prolyl cis-trans isomerase FkpA
MKNLIFILLLFSSCRSYNDRPDPVEQDIKKQEQIDEANRRLLREEAEQINDFNSRHHFEMKTTGTGLRYQIYVNGNGKTTPVLHDEVEIAYKMFFLDGTLKTQTDTTQPARFRLGEGAETRGLEEGLMLMKEGDKARLIVPAHLGYGLSGDGKRIPPATTLFYDVTLTKIHK